jgi:hypothetical protein
MEMSMKAIGKALLVGASALTLSATAASAAVVCNDEGDCWRVRGKPTYGPELRLRVEPDDWKWSSSDKYRWREPGTGHGYWRRGVWVEIK